MSLDNETLALSAVVDLVRRGIIKDLSPESQALAVVHAEQYLIGNARFPLMTEAEAEIALAPFMPPQAQELGGLGSFLKKAVKDIGGAVKKVVGHVEKYAIPAIAGFATGMATGNPIMGIANAVGNVAQVKAQSDAQKAAAATAQAAAQGDKAAIVDVTAKALVERIGRTTTDQAGSLLYSEYRVKLSAAKSQAELETVAQQIVAQQDQAGAFATANGTVDAVNGGGFEKYLPWLIAGGVALYAINKGKGKSRRSYR